MISLFFNRHPAFCCVRACVCVSCERFSFDRFPFSIVAYKTALTYDLLLLYPECYQSEVEIAKWLNGILPAISLRKFEYFLIFVFCIEYFLNTGVWYSKILCKYSHIQTKIRDFFRLYIFFIWGSTFRCCKSSRLLWASNLRSWMTFVID